MRRHPCLAASFGLAVVAASTQARAGWQGSAIYQACVDAAKAVDRQIAVCGQDEFQREDKILNAVYADRLKKAEGKLKTAIQTAQRLWLVSRDPTCEAESLVYEGGTLENVVYTSCEARMTAERVEWLKSLDQ